MDEPAGGSDGLHAALLATAPWLAAVLEGAPFVAYVKDERTRHLFVNRGFEDLFGVSRDAVVGRTNAELFPADVAAKLDAHDRAVMETGASHEYEEVVEHANGLRTFHSLKVPLRDAAGRVVALCGLSTELTDRRRTERDLRHEQELTRRLLSSSFDGVLAFDRECRYTWWNPAMERISGVPAAAVVGRLAFDVFPFLVETGEDLAFHEALAGRTTTTRDRTYTIPESGRQGFFEATYSPMLDAAGHVAGGIGIVRDVTERRRGEEERLALARSEAARTRAEQEARRFAFLAETSDLLSSSLDYEQTLAQLARLAVPMLGDLCIVDVLEGDSIRRVATVHVDPDKAVLLHELQRQPPPTSRSPHPAARVMRTGQPELLAQVDADVVAEHTVDAQHAARIRALGIRSHLAVPLVARGAVLGAMSVAVTESDRRYGSEDLALATEVARRAALAIDNARLHAAVTQELAERRRTEDALRMSELRYRALVEQSPLSTQILAPTGETLRVNRAWQELWGITLDNLRGYNVLTDPQLEAAGVAPFLRRAVAGESVAIPAIRYDPNESLRDRSRHTDPTRWVRAVAYPVKGEADEVREVVLVHEDVTAQVRAEHALRASEERLRLALTSAHMNVWTWDLTTNAIDCPDDARAFWGADVDRAEALVAIIDPDDVAAFRGALADAIDRADAEYVAEYRLVRAGGVRWVQSRGRVERDERGRALRLIGVSIDITELKRAEAALRCLADAGAALGASLDPRATLDRLTRTMVPALADWCAVDLVDDAGLIERVAVHHADEAKIVTTRTGGVQAAHAVAQVIATGEPQWVADITDDSLAELARDRDHLALLRVLQPRSLIRVPLPARGRVLGALTLAYAESGRRYRAADVELAQELARRAATAIDNARLYQQLQTEDRRKDEFLATLAHELRNPLAPIRNGLEVIKLAGNGPASLRAREIMERQLAHMVRLIDDLLDVSRVTRGKISLHRERVDLWTIVGTALEASRPMIDAAGLTLEVRLPAEPIVLEADRTRLAQVVSNLLNNAAKYTERGGKVTLAGSVDEGDAVVTVTDTGIGIPAGMTEQVFEMFAQVGHSIDRSQGGLGIGLTLVRRLVELHGGRVRAQSEGPGHGSTFVVRLPLAAAPHPSRTKTQPPIAPVTASSRRVLVVDDNEDAATTLADLLRLGGHEVAIAIDGPAALELARSFLPDIAFLDIGLPGMSGHELARELRKHDALATARLVALTGWGQDKDREQSRAAGFDAHLTKPVDPAELRTIIEMTARR